MRINKELKMRSIAIPHWPMYVDGAIHIANCMEKLFREYRFVYILLSYVIIFEDRKQKKLEMEKRHSNQSCCQGFIAKS